MGNLFETVPEFMIFLINYLLIIIALMMEAARTSETLVDIQLGTRQYIPEDSELHIRRRENLKSHIN
jgi:hypothetical protein